MAKNLQSHAYLQHRHIDFNIESIENLQRSFSIQQHFSEIYGIFMVNTWERRNSCSTNANEQERKERRKKRTKSLYSAHKYGFRVEYLPKNLRMNEEKNLQKSANFRFAIYRLADASSFPPFLPVSTQNFQQQNSKSNKLHAKPTCWQFENHFDRSNEFQSLKIVHDSQFDWMEFL